MRYGQEGLLYIKEVDGGQACFGQDCGADNVRATLAGMRKALAPAVLALVAILTQWIASGSLNAAELRTAIAGIVTATAVYFIPNKPATFWPEKEVGSG